MAGILKFFGWIIEEMLTGKRDCVSERTSQTRSVTLLSASSRSIWAYICDKCSSSGIARTEGLLLACCSSLALRVFSWASKSVLSLEPADHLYSESHLSSRFGSALVRSSMLNIESLVCLGPCNSGAFPQFSCLVCPALQRVRRACLQRASVSA